MSPLKEVFHLTTIGVPLAVVGVATSYLITGCFVTSLAAGVTLSLSMSAYFLTISLIQEFAPQVIQAYGRVIAAAAMVGCIGCLSLIHI